MAAIDKNLGKTIANHLRIGQEAKANEQLTIFIDNITNTLTEKTLLEKPQLTALFAEMLDAQQKRDFLRLADIIQYQLLKEFKK